MSGRCVCWAIRRITCCSTGREEANRAEGSRSPLPRITSYSVALKLEAVNRMLAGDRVVDIAAGLDVANQARPHARRAAASSGPRGSARSCPACPAPALPIGIHEEHDKTYIECVYDGLSHMGRFREITACNMIARTPAASPTMIQNKGICSITIIPFSDHSYQQHIRPIEIPLSPVRSYGCNKL